MNTKRNKFVPYLIIEIYFLSLTDNFIFTMKHGSTFSLLILLLSIQLGKAQINPWQSVDADYLSYPEKVNDLADFNHYILDIDQLAQQLQSAPEESMISSGNGLEIYLPSTSGTLEAFAVYHSEVMAPELAKKFPMIRSYRGISLENPGRTTRFTVSPRGFEAVISGAGPEVYVERMNDPGSVLVYNTSSVRSDAFDTAPMPCGVELADEFKKVVPPTAGAKLEKRSAGDPIDLRTYRLAIGATGEWTIQSGGTVQAALSRMVSSVNRINQVLETEVAIRLILIANNEQVIFTDPMTDPYFTANVGRDLLSVNTSILNDRVGVSAYDFGHVFTGSCTDVGGVASLASVCTNRKGAAVTCWYTANLEYVSVRIAAHEMGHQMAANHTFNNCNGNEATGNAYEPGSGSTIMSYFGLCGSNNVTGSFVPNYHVSSLSEIIDYMHNGNGNSCAQRITTSNITPDVTISLEDGFYIPIETPFELDCEGSDQNGDNLMYTWEQFDIGPGQRPRCQPSGNSPLFRSLAPQENTKRIFPDLSLILSGQQDCYELLPFETRNMSFRVTARDMNEEAGGVDWDQVNFFATAAAGPFRLEYPNRLTDTLRGGKYNLIRWDVANTDKAPVNCEMVDIVMYRNNNFNQPIELLKNTPNDGSAYVMIPNQAETNVRIRVKASDNIFFDISDEAHRVLPTTEPSYTASLSGNSAFICLPGDVSEQIMTLSILDYDAPLLPGVQGNLPAGIDVNFEKDTILPGENLDFTLDFSNVTIEGVYEFNITLTDTSGNIEVLPYRVDLESNDFNELGLLEPAAGVTGTTELPDFSWATDPEADSYIIQIATNPGFEQEDLIFESRGLTAGSYTPTDLLDLNTIYYWRVIPVNRCGEGTPTPVRAFSTRALLCQEFEDMPELSLPRGSSKQELIFNINTTAEIVDVNVIGVEGRYDNVLNLTLTLTSPEGTVVTLFKNYRCNSPLFNLGFDDEAPDIMPCPPNTGQSIKPFEPLSTFIGENAGGEWKLTVETGAFGNGGVLNTWAIQVCTNSSLAGPFYVSKDTLRTRPNTTNPLYREILEVNDPDNNASELYYILVEAPEYGDLQLNGNTLSPGDNFNQSSINGYVVEYVHGGGTEELDHFLYLVTDNGGGWLGIDTFFISIKDQNTVGTDEREPVASLEFWPNPATSEVNVQISGTSNEGVIRLYDLSGKLCRQWENIRPGQQTLFIPKLTQGLYLIEYSGSTGRITKKLMIQP